MPFTEDDWLPTLNELEVDEIKMSSAPLKAGAHYFGKYCEKDCKEYMLCSSEEKDPRKCLKYGKRVTRCAINLYSQIRENCAEEFTKYWQCVDHADVSMNLSWCRATQAIFDQCMKEKLNLERPKLGYLSKTKVLESSRPRPQRNLPLPDPVPELPDPADLPASETSDKRKFGKTTGTFWNVLW